MIPEPFLFVPFDSFLYAVDIFGYSFMSAATLFAAPVFAGSGQFRVVRLFLTANGLLLPFIVLQMYLQPLIWVAALWAVTRIDVDPRNGLSTCHRRTIRSNALQGVMQVTNLW